MYDLHRELAKLRHEATRISFEGVDVTTTALIDVEETREPIVPASRMTSSSKETDTSGIDLGASSSQVVVSDAHVYIGTV